MKKLNLDYIKNEDYLIKICQKRVMQGKFYEKTENINLDFSKTSNTRQNLFKRQGSILVVCDRVLNKF